ncbi:lipoyl(octanoyl) transferase LipB [Bdellovibrio sp. HCB117]|nr:lipoyl(octanoyl) transferase LipB [Bdellovibrio bacteriovorus]
MAQKGMSVLQFQDWGLINYEDALKKQLALVEKVSKENLPGFLVFCTHPPVVTLGRSTKPGDVFAWNGLQVEVTRGGRATYHGPSQLVIYPIVNLNQMRKGRKERDIAPFLRIFEEGIVEVLKSYGLENVEGRSLTDDTGVWSGNKKVASVGVGIRQWVSFHGAAINMTYDSQAFQGLNPCGFPPETMISLEELLKRPINLDDFKEKLKLKLLDIL